MAEIVKELKLEVYSANRIKAIVAKQYDYKSRYLLIRLTDGGEDINVEASSVVTVNAFRPNGESAAFLGSAEQDGRILVPLSYWMLELEGTVKCDVSIVDTEGRKLSSTNFQIEVERANYSGDDIKPDEHYDLLVELLAEVAQAQEAENARVAAESARVTAENGRVSAETARDTAETARASAESARDTAEGARSSAETARGTAETARASAETTRQANEASRVSAEAARAAAETAREEAEEEREHALDDYAKKDGYYEGLTAGLSESLTPYSEDSGIKQTQPFFLEGTATGNGESVADAGAYALLQEKRGNMVCVNQKVQNSDFSGGVTGWRPSNGTLAITGGIATLTCSADGNATIDRISYGLVTGHKNIVVATMKAASGKTLYISGVSANKEVTANGSWQVLSYIEKGSITAGYPRFGLKNAVVGDEVQYSVITISDLTQWFNGNIPAYLLSHPEAFGRYYKGSLAYEPGRLVPATGRYLTSVGRNIWDEEWESGNILNDGTLSPTYDAIRSKNFIEVSSAQTYYMYAGNDVHIHILFYDNNQAFLARNSAGYVKSSPFTTPAGCHFIKFSTYPSDNVSVYNHDITISLYYPGESGYDKYYPHEVLATIDTGTESLGFLDYKVPSGLITRRIGSVDFGTLNWYRFEASTGYYLFTTNVADIKTVQTAKILFSRFIVENDWSRLSDNSISARQGYTNIYIRCDSYADAASFTAAMSGVMLYYELATPTTEQGTPFQENVPIDDFGQLSWSNTDVPQGNQIFYPVDYKAAVDTLINYADGDITELAKRGSLTNTDPQTLKALVDYVNGKIPAAPTTDGTYDLVCTVTNGQPSYSWIART